MARPLDARAGACALGVLLLLTTALAASSARQKSVTVDELGHLPSGLYTVLSGDMRHATLNPPLLSALAALPVLALDFDRPLAPPAASDDPASFWTQGYHFHERHRADYRRAYAVARGVPIAILVALGLLLYAWGGRLAPPAPRAAGLLAAGFVCLSPNVLAHARLVGTDTGTAAAVALALFALHAMLARPSPLRVGLFGAALGLAQLTKFYALLLYPACALAAFVWWVWTPAPRPSGTRALGQIAAAFALSGVVLDTGYLWQEVGASLDELRLASPLLTAWRDTPVGSMPLPLPGAYLRALDGQLAEVESTIPSYVWGETFQGGRWWVHPLLLAVKTPLGLVPPLAAAVWLTLRGAGLPRREAFVLLVYPALLFAVLASSGGRQLGIRALLSAAPPVWLWAAATLARALPRRWPLAIAGVGLAATLAATLAVHPDYLAHFNVFAGGRDGGYRYAAEGNVDIGQDLVALSEYLDGRPVQLLYFGSVDPALYGIDYRIPDRELEPGLFAVSVSLYHLAYPMYDAGELRRVGPVDASALGEPIARLGGSIHVYEVAP